MHFRWKKVLTTIRKRTTKVPKGRKTIGRRWSPERTEPLLMWTLLRELRRSDGLPKGDYHRKSLSPRRGLAGVIFISRGSVRSAHSTACLWSHRPFGTLVVRLRIIIKVFLSQIFLEERFHLIVRNHTCLVIVEVNVGGSGDDEQFLVSFHGTFPLHVLASHLLKGIL